MNKHKRSVIFLSLLAIGIAYPSISQTPQASFSAKPIFSTWAPSDVASLELRVIGRHSTDPITTNKIIKRILIKNPTWFSIITFRFTVLVPINEIWEVKSFSAFIVPLNTTGLKSVEVIFNQLPVSYFPPSGQTFAVDINPKTGDWFLGPVSMIPVPPPVVVPPPTTVVVNNPGDAAPPLPLLITSDGIKWTFIQQRIFRDSIDVTLNAYNDFKRIYISDTGRLCADGSTHGYLCYNGKDWN